MRNEISKISIYIYRSKMYGSICTSFKNIVSATEAWKIYGTLKLGLEAPLLLPNGLQSSQLVQGDGSVGSIIKLNFQPGVAPFCTYKEQFSVVDNEKLVKETVMIEDGPLDKGYTLYRLRFQLIEDGENSCITRCTVEYELKDDVNVAQKLSMLNFDFFVEVIKAVSGYLATQT